MSNWHPGDFKCYFLDCDCKDNKFSDFRSALNHFENCQESTKIMYKSFFGNERKCYPYD